MKAYIDIEQARKEEVENERKAKELHKQERKDREKKEAEERLEQEKRAKKKEDKKRREQEAREAMRKDLRMEIKTYMGGVAEVVHDRLLHAMKADLKGKAKLEVLSPEVSAEESVDSDVEALSELTGNLSIHDKRKQSAEKEIADSPPMVTPAKRQAKQGNLNPKRLVLSCRHPSMKRSPKRTTPVQGTQRRKKIPATTGALSKLKYVTDKLRELGGRTVDELKQICRDEDVPFLGGKKMDAIMAIAEKRTKIAYGTDNDEEDEEVVQLQEATDPKEERPDSAAEEEI
ncbi:hypothetical protein CBR_g58152 [Chara braunii]|uniref:Uncharacterized protein n=1 Tax=Chara braunii TaxID=69332 RepID=A0A388MEN5_CHABU|nr:hypothetical protein CBR_g58152 [Chara braunii]|eukprot:GBG93014.1 hypothetical protein CBR_g58152 [Chara braunii]